MSQVLSITVIHYIIMSEHCHSNIFEILTFISYDKCVKSPVFNVMESGERIRNGNWIFCMKQRSLRFPEVVLGHQDKGTFAFHLELPKKR